MSNTRHIPNLNSARECINQAVIAVRADDPGTVDDCVTAALQYLQPDVEHIKDDTAKPAGQFLVNVYLVGDGADDVSTSRPMDAADADAKMLEISKAVNARTGVIELPLSHDRLPLHLAAVHIAGWFVTEHRVGPPF